MSEKSKRFIFSSPRIFKWLLFKIDWLGHEDFNKHENTLLQTNSDREFFTDRIILRCWLEIYTA